jgi:hypothetical protein
MALARNPGHEAPYLRVRDEGLYRRVLALQLRLGERLVDLAVARTAQEHCAVQILPAEPPAALLALEDLAVPGAGYEVVSG